MNLIGKSLHRIYRANHIYHLVGQRNKDCNEYPKPIPINYAHHRKTDTHYPCKRYPTHQYGQGKKVDDKKDNDA